MNFKLIFILVIVCLCSLIMANPIFGFGSQGGGSKYHGRSYNDIAKVLNPNPYAFPRQSPFPAQPFWTFSG